MAIQLKKAGLSWHGDPKCFFLTFPIYISGVSVLSVCGLGQGKFNCHTEPVN